MKIYVVSGSEDGILSVHTSLGKAIDRACEQRLLNQLQDDIREMRNKTKKLMEDSTYVEISGRANDELISAQIEEFERDA